MAGAQHALSLTFVVTGAAAVVVPARATPARADELWRTTCFELFWRAEGAAGYAELNLSPSGRWASYGFAGYRSDPRDLPMAIAPRITTTVTQDALTSVIDLDLATLPGGAARVGLSAVIEEAAGRKSYWALAHPSAAPDFHHPDCFTLELPAPDLP